MPPLTHVKFLFFGRRKENIEKCNADDAENFFTSVTGSYSQDSIFAIALKYEKEFL